MLARYTPDADLESEGYGPARYEVRVQIVRVVPDPEGQFEDIQDVLTVASYPRFGPANVLAGRIHGRATAEATLEAIRAGAES